MTDSVVSLLQLVRRSRLLHPSQLNEIKLRWLSDLADSDALAARLVRRGWLTPYQLEELQEGRDDDLRVGPYHVLSLLGEGALGRVYRAWQPPRRVVVALKVLRPELRSDPEVLYQFWQERVTLARLTHPAFVRALGADSDGAQYYFAMEFIDGIDLARLLERAGPLPAGQASDYVRQAAVGLHYAYENGLVHRDVKPANLLVSFADERVCILDIGSAHQEWWAEDDGPAEEAGALMGTADYIAPEQTLNPQGVDTRADVYGLGCTLYHLLAGRPPFPHRSLARKLLDHRQTPAPPLREARPELSEALEAVVRRMLEKQPADRFQTPAQVAVALAPFCRDDAPRLKLAELRPHDDAPAFGTDPGEEAATDHDPAPPAVSPRPGGGCVRGAPGGVERRASSRRGGNLVSVVVADALPEGEQLRGWVLDRSAGGLGLLVGEALEIGTLVRVRPDRPDVLSRWVQVRVIHCTPERIRWRVGCQFVQKPSADVLSGFG